MTNSAGNLLAEHELKTKNRFQFANILLEFGKLLVLLTFWDTFTLVTQTY